MQKLTTLLLVLLLLAAPAAAQTSLGETYTTDTGTTIDYPLGWTVELADNLVILEQSNSSRVVLIDYPLVSALSNYQQTDLDALVEIVANEILNSDIDTASIFFDTVFNRELARYDVPTRTNASGAVLAVRFSNDRIGMLVSINVSENTLQGMLSTFDNSTPASDDVVGTANVATEASSFIFRSGGRFSYPAGWSATPRRSGNIEYVNLRAPNDAAAIVLFDITERVAANTPLNGVLADADLNLAQNFAITVDEGFAEAVTIGNREALRYQATIFVDGDTYAGHVTVLEYSDNGIGIAVAYGALDTFALDINLVIGSFNNLGALLDFRS